ncbi:MAG: DNA-3-methyladenine glycosylase 2 family protein, partial [Eubacterium sp.]|nr:DNA-3-methyladenine glycosylase 2 family protein [Eubacterium sp.]
DLWETMVTFLISQQNNLPRIRRCISLLCEKYGDYRRTEEGFGYYTFPAPEKLAGLPEDGLFPCNLGYRSKYVVRTASDIVSGRIDPERILSSSPAKAREELRKCFGVGEKVAGCICLFSLHDLDAFPVDTHVRKVLDEHYKRGFPNRRYKGFRGVIQQYLFYYDLKQGRADQDQIG